MIFKIEGYQSTEGESCETTVRLDSTQIEIYEKPKPERSAWIEDAVVQFLGYRAYREIDRQSINRDKGSDWLDLVEIGINYKTIGNLLKPVALSLSAKTTTELNSATELVEIQRPHLKRKGVFSGIIRSAIYLKQKGISPVIFEQD